MSKTLTIYLAADLRKLNSGLRDAQTDMNRFQRSVSNLSGTMGAMLGPAMLGAATAAGYLAVSLGVDGVKAAVDDEAAASKLATTMENLGLAQDTTAVEASIDAMQRQFGVADEMLRPAFDRLIRATGDTAKATDLLRLSMDVSAGSGKSLDAVVQALGKAYDGNTAGLSKLGAGIDKTVLSTGNMDTITKELARTFGGQAKTASETYKGQLDRLTVGFSELQESFGSGFLSALGATQGKTGDLMTAMKDLEPAVRDVGKSAGDMVITLAGMITAADKAAKAGKNFRDAPNWDDLGTLILESARSNEALTKTMVNQIPVIGPTVGLLLNLSGAYDALGGSANNAYGGVSRTAMAMGATVPQVDASTAAASRYTAQAEALGHSVSYTGGNLREYFADVNATASSTGAATTETDRLTKAFELQSKVVEDGSTKLEAQVGKLEAANAAVKEYADTLAGQLLGGIDLTAAQQTGTDLGTSTMAAFDAQIAQANWFGNVLEEVKRQGGSQALIDYMAAAGPEAGGKFGQEAIDNGLIPEFSSKLDAVIASANELAQSMVPEYLTAGVDSAEQNVKGLVTGLTDNIDKLQKIGKRLGKTIGDEMKAEILAAAAAAIAEAEAARTASEARAAANAAASSVLSDQQIAQAFARIISTSNARTGYTTGNTTTSPVFG